MAIDLKQNFHMKEGTDETSYAKASYLQKKLLSLTKPINEKALRELYFNMKEVPTTMSIADLGCSSAELNNLSIVSELMEAIDKARRELGHGPKEYQIYLNDLPGNDFNTVFKSIASFEDSLKLKMGDDFGKCFVNGVPGSFYDRLFPTNSLHFVHSSSSIHWLSQVPEGIEENKENIFMGKTSPHSVMKSYQEQFSKDFSTFLQCRSKEVVLGGKMILTLAVRSHHSGIFTVLATVLNHMVFEGYIEEEKLHTFNIPFYTPLPTELEFLVEKEGSFSMDEIHLLELNWDPNHDYTNGGSCSSKTFDYQYEFARCIRSVAEPLLITHFGEEIIEEVFQRHMKVGSVLMIKDKNAILTATVSLTRRDSIPKKNYY